MRGKSVQISIRAPLREICSDCFFWNTYFTNGATPCAFWDRFPLTSTTLIRGLPAGPNVTIRQTIRASLRVEPAGIGTWCGGSWIRSGQP